jgi:uncharacterized cupredoxin-like copper-binding protein
MAAMVVPMSIAEHQGDRRASAIASTAPVAPMAMIITTVMHKVDLGGMGTRQIQFR